MRTKTVERKFAWFAALGGAAWIVAGFLACSSGLRLPAVYDPADAANFGVGFDPGLSLTAPITETSVVAARLPGTTDSDEVEVVFVGFVTIADADDGDGSGTPIAGPFDGIVENNNFADVFLSVVANEVVPGEQPVAFSQGLLSTFREDRCANCHGFCSTPQPANFPIVTHAARADFCAMLITNAKCEECHLIGSGFSNVDSWLAPDPTLSFHDKSANQICQQIYDEFIATGDPATATPAELDALRTHMKLDSKIVWSFQPAGPWVPLGGPSNGNTTPVSIDLLAWRAQVDAWVDAGLPCAPPDSRKDTVVVSQAHNGGAGMTTGSATSHQPSITFVPNPAFDPADTLVTNPAGWVHVAYASDAVDLVPPFVDNNNATDIFRTTIEVRMDEDPTADPGAGSIHVPGSGFINLVWTDSTVRANVRDQTGEESFDFADAVQPAISYDGSCVVFLSEDTDLVDANGNLNYLDDDLNGAQDVFFHEIMPGGRTLLLSPQDGTGLFHSSVAQHSASPQFAAGAEGALGSKHVVTFESLASDLVAADTNAVRDVFYAIIDPVTPSVQDVHRASVATGGVEGLTGTSRCPTAFVIDASLNEVLIAFESSKTNLAPQLPPKPLTALNVFLFDSRGGGTTTLVNQQIFGTRTLGAATDETGANTPADSRQPTFSADGQWIAYQTLAENLDSVRAIDANDVEDIMIADIGKFLDSGILRHQRATIDATGGDTDGPSTMPIFTALRYYDYTMGPGMGQEMVEPGVLEYTTQATTVGASENDDGMLLFVTETLP
jgi:hypothetical protein